MDCRERYYELIGKIEACPLSSFAYSTLSASEKKYVADTDFSFDDGQGFAVPMKKRSGSLKETPSVEVAGYSYEIIVSWEVEDVDAGIYENLERLKNSVNSLLITTFGERKMLVVPDEYGYQFLYNESDGNLKCELTAYCKCGAQRVL